MSSMSVSSAGEGRAQVFHGDPATLLEVLAAPLDRAWVDIWQGQHWCVEGLCDSATVGSGGLDVVRPRGGVFEPGRDDVGECSARVVDGHLTIGVPFVVSSLVVAAKPDADVDGVSVVQIFAPHVLGAQRRQTIQVGKEGVDIFCRGVDIDGG